MILDFNKPDVSLKERVDRAVRETDCRLCDQTFGNFFCWNSVVEVGLAFYKDSFVSRWGNSYSFPIGPECGEILEQLMAEGVRKFISLDDRACAWMEQHYPGRFAFSERRDKADYIYDREKLERLTGKKLAAKRNHINYFEQHYQWETRPITAENMQEVVDFSIQWCKANNCPEEPDLAREGCAVRRGLKHFEELGYRGLALYANGRICAFTYGEPIGKEGFCVHVEKADAELRGAYPMINREFVRSLPQEIRWINREDDTGDEGLRRAKLSYQPDLLLMKYNAEVKD